MSKSRRKLPKFRTSLTHDHTDPACFEDVEGNSQTIPDQDISIRRLLEEHTRGGDIAKYQTHYMVTSLEAEEDPLLQVDYSFLDKQDIEELGEKLRQFIQEKQVELSNKQREAEQARIKKIQEETEARKKAAEEAAKQKALPPPKKED